MFSKVELEVALLRKGIKKKDIAQLLGITKQGFHKKLIGQSEFKASEIGMLSEILGVEEVSNIFFKNDVEFKSLPRNLDIPNPVKKLSNSKETR